MNLDKERSAPYDHPKNIAVGMGRIFWGEAAFTTDGRLREAGWVLPGGERTTDEGRARAAATAIHAARMVSKQP